MTKLNIGPIKSGAQYAKNLKLAKKLKRKKQLGQLSDVLGAASKLAGGGGGTGGVSADNSQGYGKAPVPETRGEDYFSIDNDNPV